MMVSDRGGGAFGDEQTGALRYLAALREHWLLIAALVVGAVIVAALYVETATPRYQAEADVLVTPVSDTDPSFLGFSLLRQSGDPTQATLTAARLVTTPQVAIAAAKRGGNPVPSAFAHVSVVPVTQSSMVAIQGTSADPQAAARLANAVAQGFVAARSAEFQKELSARLARLRAELNAIPASQRITSATGAALESQLGTLASLTNSQDPTLQIIAAAQAPASPVWPRKSLSVGVAFVAALAIGIALALALELISPRINREDELLLEQRLPILARVPRMSTKTMRAYLAGREPLPGAVREAFRTLRASLASGRGDGFPGSLVVTSASPGEGKTMTSVNLARTLASAGQRVVLIDGDLRRPMVATVFGIGTRPNGFADVLSGASSVDDALVEAPGFGEQLRLLLASPEHAHVVDLLEVGRVEAVLDELRARADVIVIDSPPLAEVADALALADATDALLVAVRLGRTRREKLGDLRRMLARHGISPVGFVVMQRRRSRQSAYGYYGAESATDDSTALLAPEPPRHPETV